ncbi:MAG TPA: extracellular solute-binding protein [bacterium]|nr:extracellular solute-binding protein [bacterium]
MMWCGRVVLGTIAVVAMCLGLSAPRSAGIPAATAAAGGWALPTEPVTLNEWDGGDGTKSALLEELIAQYEKIHPNVTVKFETDVKSLKVAAAIAAGTAPEIFEASDANLQKYIAAKVVEPLPAAAWGQPSVDGVVALYLPHVLDAITSGHSLYAVPDQLNAHSLYINNRVFRAAGLDPVKDAPKTWDDIARLNKVLTKKQGDRVTQKGFEMRYVCDDGHWQAHIFHILVYQAGGEVIKDGKPVFNSEAGLRALTTWKSLVVAPGVTNNTCSSPYQDFAVEQDAMTFAGPHVGKIVERINPAMQGNYTVVPLPQLRPDRPATLIYSFNWTVNARASAAQKRVAWDLIHFLSSKPDLWWQRIQFLQGTKGWLTMPAARNTPFMSAFTHDLSVGKPLGRTTYYADLQSIIARMVDRVVLKDADPKSSLAEATDEFNRASAK